MNEGKSAHNWIEEFPSAITVCDNKGIIVAMNEASRLNFSKRGGGTLIGTSLFDCHPEAANKIIRKMLHKETPQTYITENKGRKRLVHQSPWYKNKEFAGLVETIIDLYGEIQTRKRN
jgi:transcriptional regulator with PAS, ATPase and Fis domain